MSDEGLAQPRAMSATPLDPIYWDDEAIAICEARLDKLAPDPAIEARYMAPEAVADRLARAERRAREDWPALRRYRAANRDVRKPDLVMIGDSLTELWGFAMPEMFGSAIVNRGISGQTSPQILLRFMADVIDLSPRRVHIMCGTNDIAGNTGPNVPDDFKRNVRAMCDVADRHGIDVLLATIPPASQMPWNPAASPIEWIAYLNAWLLEFAQARGYRFVDYFSALTDGHGGLREAFSADGVHVTRTAYRKMSQILDGHCDGTRGGRPVD